MLLGTDRKTSRMLVTTANVISETLETLRDEEQDAFDNLPEGLQNSERGQDMEATIVYMDDALGTLEDFSNIDEDLFDQAIAQIEDAKGQP